MAPSIYIYESLDDYKRFYGGKDDIVYQVPIIDLYIKNKEKLYFVTNTNNRKFRPDLYRTIVHFENGGLGAYADGDEVVVKYESVLYKPNHTFYGKVQFYPKFLRKPMLEFKIDRYVGDTGKKKKINFEHRYFDTVQNRINFILEED